MSRSAALANPVWVEARKKNDFKTFLPVLRKNLDLRKRYIDCFEVKDEPYDIVLDDYERDMTTKEVRRIFDYLKEHQAPLVKEVAARAATTPQPRATSSSTRRRCSSSRSSSAFGYTDDAWRLDPTVHPFASGTGITDIRITTRYFTEHLGGLFGTMHEFGHGLYERQIDEALERSPLARGVSLGMHESQSRMWENLVGRSLPFWRHFFPRLQELFPTLAGYDVEQWYREVNRVEPSLIRVEADEATYNLHIILRFELEQAMLGDEFPLEQLPGAVEQPDVRLPRDRGAERHRGRAAGRALVGRLDRLLPDVRARQPDLGADLGEDHRRPARPRRQLRGRASSAPLRDWLREHLHRHGRKFTPGETLERVVGTSRDRPRAVRALPARQARGRSTASPH